MRPTARALSRPMRLAARSGCCAPTQLQRRCCASSVKMCRRRRLMPARSVRRIALAAARCLSLFGFQQGFPSSTHSSSTPAQWAQLAPPPTPHDHRLGHSLVSSVNGPQMTKPGTNSLRDEAAGPPSGGCRVPCGVCPRRPSSGVRRGAACPRVWRAGCQSARWLGCCWPAAL